MCDVFPIGKLACCWVLFCHELDLRYTLPRIQLGCRAWEFKKCLDHRNILLDAKRSQAKVVLHGAMHRRLLHEWRDRLRNNMACRIA